MGDHADDAIMAGLDQEYDGYCEDDGYFYRPGVYRPKQGKTCRLCGCSGLYWQEAKEGWRLHHWTKDRKWVQHKCGVHPDGSKVTPEEKMDFLNNLWKEND